MRLFVFALLVLAPLLVLPFATGLAKDEEEEIPGDVWVAFWNVENLFAPSPPVPDETEGDRIRRPTEERYREKIRRLREVLRRMDWGRGPSIVGFAEVESEKVVRDVLDGVWKPEEYEVVFHPGHYFRKLNVALAVKKPLTVESRDFHHVELPDGAGYDTSRRSILEARVAIGSERLDLFVVHLKSKSGGDQVPTDEERRAEDARTLRDRVAAIVKERGEREDANVIVMGDFNEEHTDSLFRESLPTRMLYRVEDWYDRFKSDDGDPDLFNMGGALEQSFPDRGTAYYDPFRRRNKRTGRPTGRPHTGRRHDGWTIIDNFLVSRDLLDQTRLRTSPYNAWIAVSWDLLNDHALPDEPFGSRIFPTGVADHLPIVMRLWRD